MRYRPKYVDHDMVIDLAARAETFGICLVSGCDGSSVANLIKWRSSMKRFALPLIAVVGVGSGARGDKRVRPNLRRRTSLREGLQRLWQSLTARSSRRCPLTRSPTPATALRGYDACTAGDERFTAKNFYEKLQSQPMQRHRTSSKTVLSDQPVHLTRRSN